MKGQRARRARAKRPPSVTRHPSRNGSHLKSISTRDFGSWLFGHLPWQIGQLMRPTGLLSLQRVGVIGAFLPDQRDRLASNFSLTFGLVYDVAGGESGATRAASTRSAACCGVSARAVRCPILRPIRGSALPYRCSFTSACAKAAGQLGYCSRHTPCAVSSLTAHGVCLRPATNRPAGWPSPPGGAAASSPAAGRRRPAPAARTGRSCRRRSSGGPSCAAAAPAR